MSAAPLLKLGGADLAQLRPHLEAPADIAALIGGCATAPEALEALAGSGHLAVACRLLAHALPRREGVWWACMCARHTPSADLLQADVAALEAAELWVRRPSDEHRRAAFAAAEAASFASPEAWAAVGAFWSGESMAPMGQPVVPPAPHLAGLALAGAVVLASVRTRPQQQMARLAAFIGSAREIAAGGTGRLAPEAP